MERYPIKRILAVLGHPLAGSFVQAPAKAAEDFGSTRGTSSCHGAQLVTYLSPQQNKQAEAHK